MTLELIYTSAPRGLAPGSAGYCTVARTAGMDDALAERLESLSVYRPGGNPVVLAHQTLAVGYYSYHVLSRIADAGADYTGRGHYLAHHIAIPTSELPACGPATLLKQKGLFSTFWEGDPQRLAPGRELPAAPEPRRGRLWEKLTGHDGWPAALLAAVEPMLLVLPPGVEALPLVEELLAELPAGERWKPTFSTHFLGPAAGAKCLWRFLPADAYDPRETPGPAVRLDRPGPPPRPREVAEPPSWRPGDVAPRPASEPRSSARHEPKAAPTARHRPPSRVKAMATGLALGAGLMLGFIVLLASVTSRGEEARTDAMKAGADEKVLIANQAQERTRREADAERTRLGNELKVAQDRFAGEIKQAADAGQAAKTAVAQQADAHKRTLDEKVLELAAVQKASTDREAARVKLEKDLAAEKANAATFKGQLDAANGNLAKKEDERKAAENLATAKQQALARLSGFVAALNPSEVRILSRPKSDQDLFRTPPGATLALVPKTDVPTTNLRDLKLAAKGTAGVRITDADEVRATIERLLEVDAARYGVDAKLNGVGDALGLKLLEVSAPLGDGKTWRAYYQFFEPPQLAPVKLPMKTPTEFRMSLLELLKGKPIDLQSYLNGDAKVLPRKFGPLAKLKLGGLEIELKSAIDADKLEGSAKPGDLAATTVSLGFEGEPGKYELVVRAANVPKEAVAECELTQLELVRSFDLNGKPYRQLMLRVGGGP